jgi:hypothetical protein
MSNAELKALARQLAKLEDTAKAKRAELKTIDERRKRLQQTIMTKLQTQPQLQPQAGAGAKTQQPVVQPGAQSYARGFKHDGRVYLTKSRVVRKRRTENETKKEMERVLNEYGVHVAGPEARNLVAALMASNKGQETTRTSLVTKPIEW